MSQQRSPFALPPASSGIPAGVGDKMLSSKGGNLSASISVAFPPEQYPTNVLCASEIFARFGDIARIDMTQGIPTGRLLVTFFDFRAAQQALEVFRDKAESIPPAAYDFHAVSIAFTEWPSTMTSFRNFGELAGASICGEDMLVEFYDMRAAQQVFFSVPGCRPWPPQNKSAIQARPSTAETAMAKAAATAAAQAAANFAGAGAGGSQMPPQALFHVLKESLARVEFALDAVAGSQFRPQESLANVEFALDAVAGSQFRPQESCEEEGKAGGAAGPQHHIAAGGLTSAIAGLAGTGGTPWSNLESIADAGESATYSDTTSCTSYAPHAAGVPTKVRESRERQEEQQQVPQQQHLQSQQQQQLSPSQRQQPQASGNTTGGGAGKPVREKVKSKDLTKFDIVAEKVLSGEDERTTIMVRNISKSCTREHFVEFLNHCGLEDKYSFFYMPFDKRRNTHCGLAFVNLKTSQDVLLLRVGVDSMLASRGQSSAPPAVSYARLQGDEQLMTHFSLSAVMNGNDVRKRPIFLNRNENGQETTGTSQHEEDVVLGMPAKVDLEMEAPAHLNQNGCANLFMTQAIVA